jgi:signal transduction histidine kinase
MFESLDQQPQAKAEDSYDYETEDHHCEGSLSGNRCRRSLHPFGAGRRAELPGFEAALGRIHTGREAGLNLDRLICDEVADNGCSSERHIGLLPPRHRARNSAAAEDRAATWVGLGFAEVAAEVGGLIRQGFPLPVVLTTLCQHFNATVHGCSSSVLLLDRTGTRVRNGAGSGLPASYLKQLEGRRVRWTETPFGAAINAKTPVIVLHPVSDTPLEEAVPAAAPGLKLYEVSPILSLTGEPLGIFAVYQRDGKTDHPRFHAAHIAQFTNIAGAAIERMRSDEALKRSDEALKRSAALLERTQQLSSTCCFFWRMETDEISWSKELSQIFEFNEADVPVTLELIGTRIHPEDLPSFHEMIERARIGVSDFEFEHRLRLPDNSVKYLRVIAHRTRDPEGQLEYIGAVQDVTHRRHAEEALAKLRAELARAARIASLGVLTAAIAHEVNQPLAGIVTNASMCRRMLAVDPPDIERARESASRTIRDAERASEVVKRLRALFCKKGATCESLDLNEATREVVALSLSELERNKVILRMELAGELPPVQGDRVQLQQVILNLLLNASDAMGGIDDRPRQIVIRTERDEDERVQLSVRDTGVGFEPQGADRLFDAFFTTKNNGMGIGLSVSRSIIDSHNGRLWATPNDGPGATFSFSIPSGPLTAAVTGARSFGAIRPSAAMAAEDRHVRSL